MKTTLYVLSLLFAAFLFASEDAEKTTSSDGENAQFSKPVTYVAAIVRRGDNWQQDSLKATELQEKHLKFLEGLKAADKLIASGPLTTSSDARGLYIFNVRTIEQAQRLVQIDEAIKSGWIKMEFHIWGSRDYTVIEPEIEESTKKGNILGMTVKEITYWSLGILFLFINTMLVIRTFRGKAEA